MAFPFLGCNLCHRLDAIHYKVIDERGFAVTRAIYNVLGINKEGKKDLLGMYISKSEGANFWLGVLTDLQNRGLKLVYDAVSKEAAETQMDNLEKKWGGTIPHLHQVLARQLGAADRVFSIHAHDTQAHLHHQHRGGLSPSDT